MKKYVGFMLVLLSFTLMLSACNQSEEEKIQVYLEDYSFYDILVNFTDGKLNIEVEMIDNSYTWSDSGQLDVHVETKAILEAVKNYSKEHLDLIKEVNLYFVTRDTNKTVAEINANNDTLLENNWGELERYELPQIVDGYKFYGVTN